MYKYSIIIPVYNSEEFIREAVESILSQTYKNFEIILINDGSQDNSLNILNELKKEYPDKIIVINKENAGTSSARNTGLSYATGDYIGFLDNDDFWTSNDFLQNADEILSESKADLLVYPTQIFDDRTKSLIPKSISLKREDIKNDSFFDAAKKLMEHSLIQSAVWMKFVRKEIVFKGDTLLFPVNMRNEDTDWTAKLLLRIKSVDYYDQIVHAYRKGTDYSQTSKPIKKSHIYDLKKVIEETTQLALKSEEPNKALTLKFLSYPYLVILGQISLFDNIDEFIPFLKQHSFLLKYKKYKYMLPFYYFIKLFGIKLSVLLAGLFFKKRYPNIKKE